MTKGIVIENIGEGLMVGCATIIALSAIFLFFVKSHPVLIYELIAGIVVFGIGGYLKSYGVKKSKEEKKWKLK